MAYYIKVTPRVAEVLELKANRVRTMDGNYLLWQSDINGVPGALLTERVAYVGGAKLTPVEARAETDGVEEPAYVFTPEHYKEVEQINQSDDE